MQELKTVIPTDCHMFYDNLPHDAPVGKQVPKSSGGKLAAKKKSSIYLLKLLLLIMRLREDNEAVFIVLFHFLNL